VEANHSDCWPYAGLGPSSKFQVPSFTVKVSVSNPTSIFHGTCRLAGWRLWKSKAKTRRRQRVVNQGVEVKVMSMIPSSSVRENQLRHKEEAFTIATIEEASWN
jgi:hypothetical protein